MLGTKAFQYDNIIVTPLNGIYVAGDVLVLSWDRINRSKCGQAVSLGVYDDKCGIEWCVDSHEYVQFFIKCPVDHGDAVVHWVFDYVLRQAERRYLPPQRLKFKELAAQGNYRTIFQHLRTMLTDFENVANQLEIQ